MRVLIADDDQQILRALRILLTARGYDVIVARTGAEALRQAVEH
ncbi:MAG: DNA-binding response regulator, partial [Leifsonia sp.]